MHNNTNSLALKKWILTEVIVFATCFSLDSLTVLISRVEYEILVTDELDWSYDAQI